MAQKSPGSLCRGIVTLQGSALFFLGHGPGVQFLGGKGQLGHHILGGFRLAVEGIILRGDIHAVQRL